MTGNGDPTKIKVGPGHLFVAAVGADEPSDLTTAWPVAWTRLGYTDAGHTFTASPSFDPVEVAEEIDPIRYEATGREMKVEFSMAEITARNLSLALNGGEVVDGMNLITFEPPDPGEEVRIALGWESRDGKERWIWRKCLQTGDVAIARKKAPDKALIPASFMCEIVAGGVKPFVAIFDDTPVVP